MGKVMSASIPEYIPEPSENNPAEFRFSFGSMRVPVIAFIAAAIVGAIVADNEHSKFSPNEVIEYVDGHHILRLRSIRHSESRVLEESWFDRTVDGYTDEIVVRAVGNSVAGIESVWHLWDNNGDGWYEKIALSFRGRELAGSVTFEQSDSPQSDGSSLHLSLQPSGSQTCPLIYIDEKLDGTLERKTE